MRTFCIGDIHGCYKALKQVLERCNFDYDNDQLITLGDIADGWSDVYECVEELLKIKNRIDIEGNHDRWFGNFLRTGIHSDNWYQGGYGTARSYLRQIDKEKMIVLGYERKYITSLIPDDVPSSHWQFFQRQALYYIDDQRNYLFVHGGFNRWKTIDENRNINQLTFLWDRDLWESARSCKGEQKLKNVDGFEKIFIGHTSCAHIDNCRPVYRGGVWNLDTGAGWPGGKLTIMDVDTEEYWQSDNTADLYPDVVNSR